MFVTAVSTGLLCTLISESILLSVTEIDIEATSSLAERFAVTGSVLFYGAVVAVTLHTLNIVRGLFHGKILQTASPSSRSIESYTIASPTSIRSVLAAGADVETVLIPASDTEVPGAPTEL